MQGHIGKRPPFRNVKVTLQTDEIKFTNSNFIGKSEATDMKEGDRKLTTSKAITIQVKINDFIFYKKNKFYNNIRILLL